jgi:tRNA-dihydrouridine synthase B
MVSIKTPLLLKKHLITPRLFLAPMAGITHCAFRRLIADFGGYGALYTEMLSPGALLKENLYESPFTKKRPCEGNVIYQLQLTGDENIKALIDRLCIIDPTGIDINLGCPAPAVRKTGAGKALFDNIEKLQVTLDNLRSCWKGLFMVKCRVGDNTPGWEERFLKRLHMFEDCGVDAVCVHPRFSDEKLKRIARWNLFQWIRSETKLPLIANGDIVDSSALGLLQHCDALMIGRASVTKPWIFKQLSGDSPDIDYFEVWLRFFNYVCEDFPPEKAIGRIKEFTIHYSKNFFFGHELFRAVQPSPNLPVLRERAEAFFGNSDMCKPNSAEITDQMLP